MLRDYLTIIYKNMKSRKLRAYLTVLGIIIGIVALVCLITLGQGLQNALSAQFDKFGTRRLMIGSKSSNQFGAPSGVSTLGESDVETLKKISDIDYVSAILMQSAKIEFGKQERYRTIRAISTENIEKAFFDIDLDLESGRFIREGEKYVATIGYGVANDLFDKTIFFNNKIYINGYAFKVVGITEEQGNSDDDYAIYIPLDVGRIIFNEPDGVTAITATIKQGVELDDAEKKVEKELERARDNEDFVVTNPVKIQEQAGQILGIVNWILIGIASISILVGGIGIMNSMYTSVLERTHDIGVMKAIGARNSDILSIFLLESGFVGFTGGLIGVLIGVGVAKFIDLAVRQFGFTLLKITIDPKVIIFGLAFAFVVGLVSGTLPAVRASRLKPVEALRYE